MVVVVNDGRLAGGEAVELVDIVSKRGQWRGKARRGAVGLAWALASWTAVLLLWELAAHREWVRSSVFPPPSSFVPYLLEGSATIGVGPDAVTLWASISATLGRVAFGLVIGVMLAMTIGVTVSILRPTRRAILPIVRVLAPIAPIAWIPLGLSLFGIGDVTAVFIVTMGVVFALTVATVSAIDGVDSELVKTARSLGANSRQLWSRVILPAAAPHVFTMVRINFFAAWVAVLAAEMVGLRTGLGAAIVIGREQFNGNLIMVGIAAIGVCGFLTDALLLVIQRRVLWWGTA